MSNLQRHLPATQKFVMVCHPVHSSPAPTRKYAGAVVNWADIDLGCEQRKVFLHQPIFGAYTELFAGLSPEVTMAHNGQYLIPWGRFFDVSLVRPDIAASLKSEAEGGTGVAHKFYVWCQKQTRNH